VKFSIEQSGIRPGSTQLCVAGVRCEITTARSTDDDPERTDDDLWDQITERLMADVARHRVPQSRQLMRNAANAPALPSSVVNCSALLQVISSRPSRTVLASSRPNSNESMPALESQ
jgi:hypothetical protein